MSSSVDSVLSKAHYKLLIQGSRQGPASLVTGVKLAHGHLVVPEAKEVVAKLSNSAMPAIGQ